jgi:hypothetical protein
MSKNQKGGKIDFFGFLQSQKQPVLFHRNSRNSTAKVEYENIGLSIWIVQMLKTYLSTKFILLAECMVSREPC